MSIARNGTVVSCDEELIAARCVRGNVIHHPIFSGVNRKTQSVPEIDAIVWAGGSRLTKRGGHIGAIGWACGKSKRITPVGWIISDVPVEVRVATAEFDRIFAYEALHRRTVE